MSDELERVKEEVVFGFYEDRMPFYTQGYAKGAHELTSPITASEANHMVWKINNLEQELIEAKKTIDSLRKML